VPNFVLNQVIKVKHLPVNVFTLPKGVYTLNYDDTAWSEHTTTQPHSAVVKTVISLDFTLLNWA